jgi:hypothetical protein
MVRAWRSATQVLSHAGFECGPVCAGFGAALSFDDAGKSVLASAFRQHATPAGAHVRVVAPPLSALMIGADAYLCALGRTAFGSGQFRREGAPLLIFAPICDAAGDCPH